jgi:hypothetical protein
LVTAGVPKTLSFTTGYNLDGTVDQSAAPAVAGLAAETVKYSYNSTGQQLTSKGTTGYLQGAEFSRRATWPSSPWAWTGVIRRRRPISSGSTKKEPAV